MIELDFYVFDFYFSDDSDSVRVNVLGRSYRGACVLEIKVDDDITVLSVDLMSKAQQQQLLLQLCQSFWNLPVMQKIMHYCLGGMLQEMYILSFFFFLLLLYYIITIYNKSQIKSKIDNQNVF